MEHQPINPRQLFSDPRIFVANWLTQNNVTIKFGALHSTEMRLRDKLEASMRLDYVSQLSAFNTGREPRDRVTGFKESDMLLAVGEYIERHVLSAKLAQRAAVTFDDKLVDKGIEQLANWVANVEESPTALTVKVLQHWIWMVKRKLAGKTVRHHIVPILVGASQGKGKSTAIRHLYSPVEELSKEMDAHFFSDERKAFTFADTYVGFLDELGGLNRQAVEQVKRVITLNTISARKLHTNDVYVIPQNTSFIGTSNTSVGLIVNDTQMRRFYEITASNKIDWDVVNNTDYLTIFKSIDEEREEGYIEDCLDELRTTQQELATPEPLSMFLEDHGFKSGKDKQIKSRELYAKYRDWCVENGMHTLNSAWFSKRIKALGFEQTVLRKEKVFWLDKSSDGGSPDIYPVPATVHKIGGQS